MTAKDLLYQILDYQHSWSAPENRNSPPGQARLAQIHALCKGFGLDKKHANTTVKSSIMRIIGKGQTETFSRAEYLQTLTDIDYITSGEFLWIKPNHDDHKEIIAKAIAAVSEMFPGLSDVQKIKSFDLRWLFNNLFNFRLDVFKLTQPDGGMDEGFSTGLYYSFYLKDQLRAVIKDHLQEIDHTLWLLLDPQQREQTKEELNYPDADLDELDWEWRRENW